MATKKIAWRTEKRKVKDLIPWEKNPRKISDKEKADLTESIERLNLMDIPVINTDNKLISGHQRTRILMEQGRGEEEIDVRVPVRKLTDKEFEEANIRANKNRGDWDFEKLMDFEVGDLVGYGFGEIELGEYWDAQLAIEDDNFNPDKALEQAKATKIKPGDLIELGAHRILCGSLTKLEDLQKLMGKDRAVIVYADPDQGMLPEKKAAELYYAVVAEALTNAREMTEKNAHWFFWCDEQHVWLIQQEYNKQKITNKRICFWIKNSYPLSPNVAFNNACVPCIYGTTGKPFINTAYRNFSEIMNKEIGSGANQIDEIMEIMNLWLVRRKDVLDYEQPKIKPVTVLQKPILRCSKPGDILLDLYGGTGTTLIACEQLKRQARLMEPDPIYCEVIKQRYEKLKSGN